MRAMILIGASLAIGAAGLASAALPAVFDKSQAGLWELSGIAGTRSPERLCVGDLAQLAQIEHRGQGCKQKAIRETAVSATFTYECSGKDFGRTEIKFVTPRNFKIVSQGIAGGLPFAHTVQARRVGDCDQKIPPPAH